jgi:hypothetical protein
MALHGTSKQYIVERLEREDAAQGMGARERREHFAHHDIPDELIERWAAARRKRTKPSPPVEVLSDTNNAPARPPADVAAPLK